MASSASQFGDRLRRIEKKHRKLAKGARTVVDKTGLERLEPRRQMYLPLGPLLFLIAAFVVFKGFLLFYMGPDAFATHLQTLNDGTMVEHIGATIMQPDIVTRTVADIFARVF